MDKFFRGVRHIRLFKQKNGTKFRFCLEPLLSAYYISPTPRGNIYSREHGCRDWSLPGCGAEPRLTKSELSSGFCTFYFHKKKNPTGVPVHCIILFGKGSPPQISFFLQNHSFPSFDIRHLAYRIGCRNANLRFSLFSFSIFSKISSRLCSSSSTLFWYSLSMYSSFAF